MVIIIRKGILLLSALLLFLSLTFYFNGYKLLQAIHIKNQSIVLIDPGHGGIDGGAISKNGVKESDINLEISFKLKDMFEESGWKVILTRDKDEGLYSDTGTIRSKKMQDLINRQKMIEREKPDFVILIHLNSFPDTSCYGAQTFYPGKSPESKLLAEQIQKKLVEDIDNENKRKSKEKNDIFLFKSSDLPTVLVECGFLSNSKEEELLQENQYQELLAKCIFEGLMKYCTLTNNPPKKSIEYIVNK